MRFIDTNVPMYAAGAAHPLKASARRILEAIAEGRLDAVTDAEVFQEILYRYLSIGKRVVGFQVFDEFLKIITSSRVLPITVEDVSRARQLAQNFRRLSPRDCIHVAVMERAGIREIITADRAFEAVPFIQRIPIESF